MAGWDKLREDRYKRQIKSGLIEKGWQLESRPDDVPEWESLSDEEKTRYDDMMAIYAAMMDEVDKNIGKLVTALDDRGVLDNTLILFMSDNGGNAETGVKGKYEGENPGDPHSNVFIGKCWAHLNNPPFRKYKHFNHEGGTATPLIAHWPAAIKPRTGRNGWITTPTHLIDIMATCVDLGIAEYPNEVDGEAITPMRGQSLTPLLPGEGAFAERPLYWEHEGNAAIRVGDWKLVRQGLKGKWQYFNLDEDRTEQSNPAEKYPLEVAKLREQWRTWARSANVFPKPQKKSN